MQEVARQELAARAVQLHQAGKLAQAERLYRDYLAHDPNHAAALQLLAVCLHQRGKSAEALPFFERSLARDPSDPSTHINHALALNALGRRAEGMAASERAVAANPHYAGARNSLGAALYQAQDFAAAEVEFRKALALKPDYAEALANLGLCAIERGDTTAALDLLRRSLKLAPGAAATLSGLGNASALAGDQAAAAEAFGRLLTLDPKNGYARAHLVQAKRQLADWRGLAAEIRALTGLEWSRERDLPSPFILHAISDDAKLQREVAQLYAARIAASVTPLPPVERTPARLDANRRIRLGYLSPDFRQHPIATLIVDLLKTHERQRFEVFAFSYGADDGSALRSSIAESVDQFIDIANLTPRAAAETIRAAEIDILIDLAGFTTHSRPGIAAHRPAPVQAHYLGFLGTMGAPFIDYIVADAVAVPGDAEANYSERIARVPSLQVNPARPAIGAPARPRAAYGLPDEGIVFCCFNNTYKIAVETFEAWMRILKRVPRSVLWLFAEGEAANNLRREAVQRGVDAARLVFAARVPYAEHLERHGYADLFLDTLPYNAGTTASDALWAGLPVLTTPGRTFASRMAASLLQALDMPELIAPNLRAYEDMAVTIGVDPAKRTALKTELAAKRAGAALFDLDAARRALEAAYGAMIDRWRNGLEPANITIDQPGEVQTASGRAAKAAAD